MYPVRGSHAFTNCETRVFESERERIAHEPCDEIVVLVLSLCEENHSSLRRLLAAPEFVVYPARSVAEALSLVERTEIAVVITECRLGKDGWKTVWRKIRQCSRRPQPRLLVTTAAGDDRLCAAVLKSGAFDIVVKPFGPEEVVWAVRDAGLEWQREQELRPATHAPRKAARGAAV